MTRRLHIGAWTRPGMDVRQGDECGEALRAPDSAFSHIDSLRNEKSLAPLALAHLVKGTERNDLDEG